MVPTFTTRPELRGSFGMVASTHWLASASGMAVLEKGGNAFDAAVAAGFVLQVVEPHLNGPGGDMPAIVYDAGRRETRVICGQGTAPARLTTALIRSLGLDSIPGDGHLAACVPGAFGAWLLMLERYGTLRLRDVLEYAIGYAEHGYPVLPAIAGKVASVEGLFREHWPSSAAVYFERGAPVTGHLFSNPDLAATYRRILREAESAGGGREAEIERARRAYYEGFVAEAIDNFVRHSSVMDCSGSAHQGVLDASDMHGWRASIEPTASLTYRNFEIHKTAPWGQGPVFLQQVALLEGRFGDAAFLSPEHLHLAIESAKLAFADREAWYGDDAGVPLDALLSSAYTARRLRLISSRASDELRPGSPDGRDPVIPRWGDGQHRRAKRLAPAWRYMPRRRRRPEWKPGLGDAVGRVAPLEPGCTRAGLPARDKGADVQPRGGASERVATRQATTDHPQPLACLPRRGAVHGLRHAGRRCPGSMDSQLLHCARRLRTERPAGHRRPELLDPAFSELLLST